MPDLLLLVGDPSRARKDNPDRFARGFDRAGWTVTALDHENLEIRDKRLIIEDRDLRSFDLIWPMGFGRQISFFDRMQMLAQLDGVRFVTSPTAMLHLHGKHRWLDAMPETHTSTRASHLYDVVSSGGDWVIKPTAGSFGRDVSLIREGCATLAEVTRLCEAQDGGYLMAQRYLPEVNNGEKRTLVAGGRIIDTYLRVPARSIASNLAAGGEPQPACLTSAELELVAPIGTELASLGAGFAAIDTVYPHLMEVNVANPGGLATIADLTGVDQTDLAVQSIIEWISNSD
jgi:glutathione synthase